MRAVLLLSVLLAPALAAVLVFPAHADVSGPVCVTDGDTLVVNGKRRHTGCVGGTRVRLFGIDAPELKQKCKAPRTMLPTVSTRFWS